MIRVLIPSKKNENSFFQEITKHSETEFVYGDLNTNVEEYQFILVQWIEQLLDWQEPTESQLLELEKTIKIWKGKNIKIIHVFHNEKRHYGMTFLFEKLYKLILQSVDIFIHFGEYSLEKYKVIYNDSMHVKINHPLYLSTFHEVEKNIARANMGISNDTLVIIIPGTIRNLIERKLVLKHFSSIKKKNKLLIAPRMYYRKITYLQKGYNYLKQVPKLLNSLDFLSNRVLKNKNLMTGKMYLSNEEISRLMCASDIVWTPRLHNLNSGIVYLAYTFKKVVFGPDIGNIGNVLRDMGMPTYNPENPKSIKIAMEQSIKLVSNDIRLFNDSNLKKYDPRNIAKEWDELLFKVNKLNG